MSHPHSIDTGSNYVLLSLQGEWNREENRALLQEAISRCRAEHLAGVVVDGRGLTSQPDELDRYLVAERLAEIGQDIRFAAVWQAEHISKLAEDVARSRGIRLLVTDSWDQAVEFIRGS